MDLTNSVNHNIDDLSKRRHSLTVYEFLREMDDRERHKLKDRRASSGDIVSNKELDSQMYGTIDKETLKNIEYTNNQVCYKFKMCILKIMKVYYNLRLNF